MEVHHYPAKSIASFLSLSPLYVNSNIWEQLQKVMFWGCIYLSISTMLSKIKLLPCNCCLMKIVVICWQHVVFLFNRANSVTSLCFLLQFSLFELFSDYEGIYLCTYACVYIFLFYLEVFVVFSFFMYGWSFSFFLLFWNNYWLWWLSQPS